MSCGLNVLYPGTSVLLTPQVLTRISLLDMTTEVQNVAQMIPRLFRKNAAMALLPAAPHLILCFRAEHRVGRRVSTPLRSGRFTAGRCRARGQGQLMNIRSQTNRNGRVRKSAVTKGRDPWRLGVPMIHSLDGTKHHPELCDCWYLDLTCDKFLPFRLLTPSEPSK